HAVLLSLSSSSLFFFNDTAPTEIYTLSLHDALPILAGDRPQDQGGGGAMTALLRLENVTKRFPVGRREITAVDSVSLEIHEGEIDRKSTRLNSSHVKISYAVFCLKKKKQQE